MQKIIKIQFAAVRRIANLVDLEKCCKMRIWMQKSASIQKRTSLLKLGVPHWSGRGHLGIFVAHQTNRQIADQRPSTTAVNKPF